MKKPLCALVIGHSQSSPGAINASTSTSEFIFNRNLAQKIIGEVNNVDIVQVLRGRYRELPEQINNLNPDFIISLHCNAFNQQVSGTETLFARGSIRAKLLAAKLQTNLVNALQLHDRGTKQTGRNSRGGYLLHYTNAPCIIAEPFFIDNDKDLQTANSRLKQLAKAFANTIESYAEQL